MRINESMMIQEANPGKWKSLYKTAGILTILMLVIIPVQIIIFTLSPHPQTVFAKLLNVSPSSIRQWEQGKRTPSGSTKVLLELLETSPHHLDYRIRV